MKNKKIINVLILSNIILIGIIFFIISRDFNIIKEKQTIKEMDEIIQVTELNNQITKLEASHVEYANYIEECKNKIAIALTNEGVTTSKDDTLETMATNISKVLEVKTSDATATADNISQGKTAYVNGQLITGNGADNIDYANKILESTKIEKIGTYTSNTTVNIKDLYPSTYQNMKFILTNNFDSAINTSGANYMKYNSWGASSSYTNGSYTYDNYNGILNIVVPTGKINFSSIDGGGGKDAGSNSGTGSVDIYCFYTPTGIENKITKLGSYNANTTIDMKTLYPDSYFNLRFLVADNLPSANLSCSGANSNTYNSWSTNTKFTKGSYNYDFVTGILEIKAPVANLNFSTTPNGSNYQTGADSENGTLDIYVF